MLPVPYRPLIVLAGAVLVVASLYFAQAVLIPLALAMLLAFLLHPIVDALERRGMRGTFAAPLVVFSSLGLLAGVILGVTLQVKSLVEELPHYRENIGDKLEMLRAAQDGPFSDIAQETLDDIAGELEKTVEPGNDVATVPVRIENGSKPLIGRLPTVIEALASAGLVIVLVLFLLLGRKPLRDRVILLFGRRHLTVTTKALDEASSRISRYLLVQATMNAGFGLCVTLALFALGVDYALLWGFLAALLRFIPYVGPWLGAGLPILLSLAMFPGWTRPLMVIGVFIVLELTLNMLIEPLVYGKTAGVSEVALLIAIAFWTWLWGPIGLILATPLTVCLVVLGKYVPQLEFIALAMGEATIADPEVRFYQRLLARDEDEAMQIVEGVERELSREEMPDALLLPALISVKRDLREGVLDEEDGRGVLAALRNVLDALDGQDPDAPPSATRPLILAYPAADELDRLALVALGGLVRRAERCAFELLGSDVLLSELVERVRAAGPAVVCVGSVAPGGLSRALYVCKRLRVQCSGLRVVVGRFGGSPEYVARLQEAGADVVCAKLSETREELHGLAQLDPVEVRPHPRRDPARSEPFTPPVRSVAEDST